MFVIIGIVLVFGAVVTGFLMEKGHLAVLVQPAEFLIIVGAALGTLLIANPLHTLKQIFAGVLGTFGKSHFGKDRYISSLKMMYELLNKVRGDADQRLRVQQNPLDPSNRRISLIVQYVQGQPLQSPISPKLGMAEKTTTVAIPPPAPAAKPSSPAPPQSLTSRLLSKLHRH